MVDAGRRPHRKALQQKQLHQKRPQHSRSHSPAGGRLRPVIPRQYLISIDH